MNKEEHIDMARKAGFRVGPSRDGPDDVWGVGADLERFAKLVAEKAIKEALAQPESDYERGFIDGMQKQMQSSVDRAVNAMTQPTYYIPSKDQHTWVGLTDEDICEAYMESPLELYCSTSQLYALSRTVEAKIKQKNGYAKDKNT